MATRQDGTAPPEPTLGYVYLGDRLTDPCLRGQPCEPERRPDGRCVVGRSKQLVRFTDGRLVVVLRRRLRRIPS